MLIMRDEILNYLIKSKFVESYTKKLVYPSDKDNLQDDYISEVWLQLCEVQESKWDEIMNNNKNSDPMYGVRNFVSVIIKNTVRSTTSSAYRKLKKQSTIADNLSDDDWEILANTIPDNQIIF